VSGDAWRSPSSRDRHRLQFACAERRRGRPCPAGPPADAKHIDRPDQPRDRSTAVPSLPGDGVSGRPSGRRLATWTTTLGRRHRAPGSRSARWRRRWPCARSVNIERQPFAALTVRLVDAWPTPARRPDPFAATVNEPNARKLKEYAPGVVRRRAQIARRHRRMGDRRAVGPAGRHPATPAERGQPARFTETNLLIGGHTAVRRAGRDSSPDRARPG